MLYFTHTTSVNNSHPLAITEGKTFLTNKWEVLFLEVFLLGGFLTELCLYMINSKVFFLIDEKEFFIQYVKGAL